jgi:hypothetical protein
VPVERRRCGPSATTAQRLMSMPGSPTASMH